LDTLIPSAASLAGDPAVIARAEALRPAIEAASNEIEKTRRLPPALLDKLHEARLFRLLLPRSSNGIETDPITFFHVIETIARGDASTAWCVSQGGGCAMTAAYLDLPVAREIFGNDPRRAVRERYASREAYVEAYASATLAMADKELILTMDVNPMIERAGQFYDRIMAHSPDDESCAYINPPATSPESAPSRP